MIASWNNLFVAVAGAGAALAGLIIVAMSVNVKTILRIPGMTSRAGTTIAVLTLMVILALAGLFPDQSDVQFGAVVTVCAAAVLFLSIRSLALMVNDAPESRVGAAAKGLLGVVPATIATISGVLLVLGSDAGLVFLAASMLVSIATSVLNAWVLLVEILR